MTIQKKSLISSLNTTKKALVATSAPTQANPSAPISARVLPRKNARIAAKMLARKKQF